MLTKLISKSLYTRIRRYNLYVYLLLSANTYKYIILNIKVIN